MVYRFLPRLLAGFVLFGIHLLPGTVRAGSPDTPVTGYWVPAVPPRAHYTIDCRIDPRKDTISVKEKILFNNTTHKAINELALNQACDPDRPLQISVGGKPVSVSAGYTRTDKAFPALFQLPEPIPPGKEVEIIVEATQHVNVDSMLEKRNPFALTYWYPRIWWGFDSHSDFHLRIEIPPEYIVATSGRYKSESGYYHARDVRSFGLVIGKGLKVIEEHAGDVLVRCLHTTKGEECARLLLETSVDAINFYRERFGFYPYTILTIIPGMDYPAGGYPVATSIVAVHGQERFSERPEIHWRWITAHEIGHQYWLEYVLTREPEGWGWLMIGLGIYADREYVRAKSLSLEKHRGVKEYYIAGIRRGLDTRAEVHPDFLDDMNFDFNNVVVHGKGYSIVSALGCLLGDGTFDRICQRCLKDFGGRRLGAHEFQVVCEEESKQDLEWFFDQWVRSDRYLSYQVISQKCSEKNGRYLSEVEVECLGTLKMPVPVRAYFEDGSDQQKFTDRLLEVNVLQFESRTPLKEVRLDPDDELPLVIPPLSVAEAGLAKKIQRMSTAGTSKQALHLFKEAQEIKVSDPLLWGRLGLILCDWEHYPEALQIFRRASELLEEDSPYSFLPLVLQGHILDLLGRRQEAIRCYQEALERDTGRSVRLDRYGIDINRRWIEERLQKPFER